MGVVRGAVTLLVALGLGAARAPAEEDATPFGAALRLGEDALAAGKPDEAKRQVDRALERDARSPRAWDLRARWAAAVADKDELLYALHREMELLHAQGAPKAEVQALRKRIEALDPMAKAFLELTTNHVERLMALAKDYERTVASSEAWFLIASVCFLCQRLARA